MSKIFIFPLPLVLMPRQKLPLKIFEQRYIYMTKECIKTSQPFGINLQTTKQIEHKKNESFCKVGCTAKIDSWDMPKLGIFYLNTTGQQIYEIKDFKVLNNGLIEGDIVFKDEPVPFINDRKNKETLAILNEIYKKILIKLNRKKVPDKKINDSLKELTYSITSILPLKLEVKQRILEEKSELTKSILLIEELKKIGLV